jgi:hypothetical protein
MREGARACDIHHFAQALSYPRCEVRARARMRVQHDQVHDRKAGNTKNATTKQAHNGSSNVSVMHARNVEMLDVPL